MSRFEGHFDSTGKTPIDADELYRFLTAGAPGSARQEAIACYLSASEGWDEAVRKLGGAFAGQKVEELRNAKE